MDAYTEIYRKKRTKKWVEREARLVVERRQSEGQQRRVGRAAMAERKKNESNFIRGFHSFFSPTFSSLSRAWLCYIYVYIFFIRCFLRLVATCSIS